MSALRCRPPRLTVVAATTTQERYRESARRWRVLAETQSRLLLLLEHQGFGIAEPMNRLSTKSNKW